MRKECHCLPMVLNYWISMFKTSLLCSHAHVLIIAEKPISGRQGGLHMNTQVRHTEICKIRDVLRQRLFVLRWCVLQYCWGTVEEIVANIIHFYQINHICWYMLSLDT